MPLQRLVVYNQQCPAGRQVANDGAQRAGPLKCLDRCRGHARQVKSHRESGAFARLAGDCQFAAHELGQQMGDGQSQTCPGLAGASSGTATLEWQKNTLLILRCDANARVHHFNARDVLAKIQPQHNAAAGCKAHSVGQQVDQNLPQPLGICTDVHRRHT